MNGWSMLCKASSRWHLDNEDWSDYVAEPKHDGMRAGIHRDDNGVVRVYGRSGKEYTAHVPHLVEEFERILPHNSVLDGELAIVKDVVWEDGFCIPVVDFNKTMRVMGSGAGRAIALQTAEKYVAFILFDILEMDGVDVGAYEWYRRRRLLESVFEGFPSDANSSIWPNPAFKERDFGALYDRLVEAGIEGLILKRSDGKYVRGGRPNRNWYKVKVERTFDVVVMGFTDGKGKFEGQIGAVQYGAYDADGNLQRVGQCSGMNDDTRRKFSDFRDDMESQGLDVAKSGIVIEVKCNDLVGSGEFRTPRHPQFVAVREDKHPAECLMEQFRVED